MFFARLKLPILPILAVALCAAGGLGAQTKDDDAPVDPAGFPENSPEHAALLAASKYLSDDDFTLRQDYWQNEISTVAGKAIRLQFFPHMKYRLFFAAGAGSLPEGAKLHVRIMDREMKELASGSMKPKSTVAVLKFEPKKTGLYMVLMRIEAPEEAKKDVRIPCVLFYGYE